MSTKATRASTDIFMIGQCIETLSERHLPTILEVLQFFFNYTGNKKEAEAKKEVVRQVLQVWARARIPTKEERSINEMFNKILENYKKIKKNKGRNCDSQKVKEVEFKNESMLLFDIAHRDAINLLTIDEDKNFLVDQRTERKWAMAGIDQKLFNCEKRKLIREEKRQSRVCAEQNRKKMAEKRAHFEERGDNSSSSSSDSELTNDPDVIEHTSPISTTAKKQKTCIVSKNLAAACDRKNLSLAQSVFVVAETAKTLGFDIDTLAISKSTMKRRRDEYRLSEALAIKNDFINALPKNAPLIVHWDGKILPNLTREGSSTQNVSQYAERLAIIISGPDLPVEKLLAIPKISGGTGEIMATEIKETLDNWRVTDNVVGMSFDTTASNTGQYKGACRLLEEKLERELIHLPCRHHIFEIVCGSVFKKLLGPSTGPEILIFKRFRDNWPLLNTSNFNKCQDSRLFTSHTAKRLKDSTVGFIFDVLDNDTGIFYLPREDYLEILELTLLFLGETPPYEVQLRKPGAFHHARWMAKVIYCIKIYLFRDQFDMTLTEESELLEFCLFITLIYVKSWSTAPNALDAPINDLNLCKDLMAYAEINASASDAAVIAFQRHLWYLGPNLLPLSLFSSKVSADVKLKMIQCARALPKTAVKKEGRKYDSKVFPANLNLNSFVDANFFKFFNRFYINQHFLNTHPNEWDNRPDFKDHVLRLSKLKVVNDSAERGIAMISTFNNSITQDEDQKQFLLQVIEKHRKEFPTCKKSTLATTK